MSKTIEEVRTMKIDLQNEIGILLWKFTEATKMTVTNIYLNSVLKGNLDYPAGYIVKVLVSI